MIHKVSLACVCLLVAAVPVFGLDPDAHKTMEELITEKGYPVELHSVVTEDGYELGTFRIARGRKEVANASVSKPPVILMHGLLDSSYTWVVNSVSQSLAFLLADAGFDVWLPNNRGNHYSQKSVTVPTNCSQFWNLSFDDMGRSDVPAVVDYVLHYTGRNQLAYVGHSEGTAQMFAAPHFDTYNELPKKIVFFGALAPATYVSHMKSPLFLLMSAFHVDTIWKVLGRDEFLPGDVIDKWAPYLCNVLDRGCDVFLELACGPSHDINESRIQVYVSGTPADTSVKNMAHWAQSIRRDQFEMFDYGSAQKNQAIYGKSQPPPYDLSKLAIPTVLYSGTDDWLAVPRDVERMVSEMNPEYVVDHIVIDGYAHLDFVWGVHANTLIYADLIERITKYLGPGVVNTAAL